MLKILAIDDNSDNLISLKAIIDDAFPGSVMFTALNGPKGIELAIANYPDVILLDIIMPGMDGFEVCRLLKLDEQVRDIPVVFLTALKGDKENRIKALEVGAEGFLSKPIDEIELTVQIRAMVKIKTANERKRNEKEQLEMLVEERTQELVRSQAVLKGIFENLQDAYFQVDLSGYFTIVSPSAIRMYGFESANEIIGQPAEFLYADPHERASLLSKLSVKNRIEDYVCEARKKDGTTFWSSMNVQLIRNDDGKAIGTEGVVRDISERIKVEKALIESEEKYRLMVDLLPDAVIIHEGGKFVFANPTALKTVGANSFEQLIERPLMDYVHPDFRNASLSKIKEIYSTGQPSPFSEEKFVTLKDEIIDVEVIGIPVTYMGKPAIQTIIRDITLRKMAEEKLRINEERLRNSLEAATDAIWEWDVTTSEMYFSPRWYEILGYQPHEIKMNSKEWVALAHPDDRDAALKTIYESIANGLPYEIEFRNKHSDGHWVWCLVKGKVTEHDAFGKPTRVSGTSSDITIRKQTEKALRESELKYRSLIENTTDVVFCVNEKGEYQFANQVFASIFGKTPDYFVGKTYWDVYSKEEADFRHAITKRVFETGMTQSVEISVPLPDKTLYFISKANPIKDDTGKVILTLISATDITERKKTETVLKESEERFRHISSSISDISYSCVNDPEGNSTINWLYGATEQITGYTIDELFAMKCWGKLVLDEDFPIFKRHILGVLPGKSETCQLRLRRKDDNIVWIQANAECVKGPEGTDLNILYGGIVDITERKRAEELLRESEERLRLISDSNTDIICSYDIQSRFTSANRTLCETMQLSEATIIGKTHEELHFPDAQCKEWAELHKRVLEKGHTIFAESKTPMPDGNEYAYEIALNPLHDTDSKIVGIGVVIRDITERKKSEQALRESQQLFQGLFNASPDAIVLIDPHHPTISWPIVDCNEACCRMNGYTREEMIGQSIDLLNGSNGTPEDRISYYNILRRDGIIHAEITHLHKNGQIFPIETSSSIISIGGHEMVLGIDRDITERKQAEMALKESEDRYRQFISQVSEGVYRFECDQPIDISLPLEEQVDFICDHMFIAECNDAFLKIHGIKDRKDMIGKGHLYFHSGRYSPVNRDVLVSFIDNGYHLENAMTEEVNHQGQITYISNNSLGIIENNQLVRIWGTQIDITEKKHADRVQQVLFTISNATLSSNDLTELIEIISNELAGLIDSTNFFIAFYDESSKMLSTVFEKGDRDKIDSWPAEKSLTGYVIKHQKSVMATESDVNKLCEAGEIEIVGIPSKIWMGVPLAVNKKVIGAIVVQSYDNPDAFTEKEKLMLEFVSHQISTSIERKKIEQELKLMGKAFDQSPVTIVITDPNGVIEYVNPKFTATTGYTQDEVKGQNPRVLQSGSQSNEFYQELWKTIMAGKDWVGEFQNKRKNGEIYWESAVISPITKENGDVEFFMAIKEEITDKKKMISELVQARNKAEESDRLKSAFLANMSHEIRTPLNSIIGFSELMADPDFDAGQQTEFAKIIINSGNSLLSIISDIMDFSKIEAGQIIVRKIPFVLQTLISSLQNEYSFTARGKGIELRIDPLNPKDDIWISSDENRLKQVLVNLVGNAIKFTKEGYVEIGIKETGDCIQFRVSDTGIGIAEEYHNEIFERFRQVESSNSRKYGGNGLGLAISKSLIEMMGGKIWLESVQRKGSTFYFTIPIGSTTI